MWNSKIKVSLLIIIFSSLLVGCLQPGTKSASDISISGNEKATFQITSLVKDDGPQEFIKSWNLPKKKELILTACIIDKTTRDRVIHQQFKVETQDEIFRPKSDQAGCIKWREPIPFRFFGSPTYLNFERKIIGEGIKKGTYTVSFAYDPWKSTRGGDHAEFVWLNQPDLIDAQWMTEGLEKVRTAQTAQFQHELLVDGMKIQLMQDQFESNGIGISMDINMNPYVRLQQLTGEKKRYDFEEGRFDISASIIGVKMGDTQDVNLNMLDIGVLDASNVKMRDGKLHVTFQNFTLKDKTTKGNLVLALQISPKGISNEVLKPFKVLYKMGDFYQWLGQKSPMILQENNTELSVTYDDLLKKLPVDEVEVNKARERAGLQTLDAFEFDYFDIEYNAILPGETATNRTVSYNVRVCVSHPLRNNRKVEYEQFYVKTDSTPDVDSKYTKTDKNGCFSWIDTASHYYYKPERYLLNKIKISHSSGFERNFKIAINPWDLFATFGKDLQEDPAVLEQIEDQDKWEETHPEIPYKIESRFNVSSFQYTAIKFDYEIEQDLSLKVNKTVLMRIDPEVQRYSSMTYGRRAVEWLRDGIWLLKIGIHKDYLDPGQAEANIFKSDEGQGRYSVEDDVNINEKHFVDYRIKLVRVINGRIVTPITFSMQDLRLMRIRSNLVIQLEPIDETQLQLANWFSRKLDESADLDQQILDYQRQAEETILREAQEFVYENLGTHASKRDGELETARAETNPKKADLAETFEGLDGVDDETRRDIGEREILMKKEYRQRKRELISSFLARVDSVDIRQAIHKNDLGQLNQHIHDATQFNYAVNSESGQTESYPVDLAEFVTSEGETIQARTHLQKINGVKVNFFAQEGNAPLTADLLEVLDEDQDGKEDYIFEATTREMAELRLNDFTINPAAADFDLELIIEPFEVSGLRKRTFLGPITYLLNSNGSYVRPTDTLDEVFCINNSCADKEPTEQELREEAIKGDRSFEYKRFYNSVRHFFKKHVDDLIQCKDGSEEIKDPWFCGPNAAKLSYAIPCSQGEEGRSWTCGPENKRVSKKSEEKHYYFMGLDELHSRQVQAASLMSNFVEGNGLDFVSVDNSPIFQMKSDCIIPFYDDSCKEVYSDKVVSSEDFLMFLDQRHLEEKSRVWSKENEQEVYSGGIMGGVSRDDFAYDLQEYNQKLRDHESSKGELKDWIRGDGFFGYNYNPEKFSETFMYPVQPMSKSPQDPEMLNAHHDSVSHKICVFMVNQLVDRLEEVDLASRRSDYQLAKNSLLVHCNPKNFYENGRPLIVFDKKMRVHKTREFRFKGGKSMNVNVASAAGVDQKFAKDKKVSWDWMSIPRRLPVIGTLLFSGFGAQVGTSASVGRGTSTTINNGTYLVTQMATFDIELERYEQCAVVKMNHGFLANRGPFRKIIDGWSRQQDKVADAIGFGLMLCTGEVEEPKDPDNTGQNKPYPVRERYYYFTQHFTEGDMLDAGDIYNHPWLLMLRGRRDFNIFMAGLNGYNKDITAYSINTPVAHVESYTWPITNLVDTYLDVQPTFPGMYTVHPSEPHDFPWGAKNAMDSFSSDDLLGLGNSLFPQYKKYISDGMSAEEAAGKVLEENPDYTNYETNEALDINEVPEGLVDE